MDKTYDAIIIGAGPAGSSTAIMLARNGWRVALIEKASFPRRKVCGECIAASNLPLLDALGIGKALEARFGSPLRQITVSYRAQTVRADLPLSDHFRYPWGYAVGRDELDTLLLEQARQVGADVFCPWAAQDVQGQPGHMVCTLKKVHTHDVLKLEAPVLIAANGSWEISKMSVGRHRGTAKSQSASDLFAFKADFESGALEAGLLPVLSFKGGYGGMVVQGRCATTLAFCIRRDILAQCRRALPGHQAADAAAAYVRQACCNVDAMLKDGRQRGPWLTVGPIQPGIRISRHKQGIFLVGNAAGEAHPIIGEGISMAIQSACLLTEILLARDVPTLASVKNQQDAQSRYVAAWRHAFTVRIRLAALFAHAAMRPGIMKTAFPILRRYPSLLTYAARWSGKVDCVSCDWMKKGKP